MSSRVAKARHLSLVPPPAEEAPRPPVPDYYVHAVLQAARAHRLGLDLDAAKSWGLNRAIFYEAAKKGYLRRRRKEAAGAPAPAKKKTYGVLYPVGREKAYAIRTREGLRFVIGGKPQTPEAFDKQIRKRFPNWDLVWSEALALMDRANPNTLKSPSRFHDEIYKKWRAELATRWPRGEQALSERRRAA